MQQFNAINKCYLLAFANSAYGFFAVPRKANGDNMSKKTIINSWFSMGNYAPNSIIQFASIGAVLCVIAMFSIYLQTGVGEDPLQYIHKLDEYRNILLSKSEVLRATIGLDNIFIICYTAVFLSVGTVMWKSSSSKLLLAVGVGLMLLTALLDFFEDVHFQTMISAAQNGFEIGLAQMEGQVWLSMVKFHISYLGLFLIGICLPHETKLEKLLTFVLIFVQAPVGIMIYAGPQSLAYFLVLTRFGIFIFSLVATALIFRGHSSDLNELA